MYLIGFFTSPLPYIVLFGLYMSGFAFFNWKAARESADEQECRPEQVYVVSDPDHDMLHGVYVLPADDLSSRDQAAANSDDALLHPLPRYHHPPLHPLPFPAFCRPVALLFLESGQAVRPPPMS